MKRARVRIVLRAVAVVVVGAEVMAAAAAVEAVGVVAAATVAAAVAVGVVAAATAVVVVAAGVVAAAAVVVGNAAVATKRRHLNAEFFSAARSHFRAAFVFYPRAPARNSCRGSCQLPPQLRAVRAATRR